MGSLLACAPVAGLVSLLLAQPMSAAEPTLDWLPEQYSVGDASTPAGTPFWLSFDQPGLTQAVERGLRDNPDVGALDAISRQQRALASQSMAGVLPSLSFDVQGQMGPFASLGFGFGIGGMPSTGPAPELYATGSAKLNGTLAVDLWGRTLTNWKASRLGSMAAEGDRDAGALVLASRIAGAWLDVVSATRQRDIVQQQLKANQDLLEVVRLRYQGGNATALDVLQQEQNLASIQTQLPLARAAVHTFQQVLAVAEGMDPTRNLPTAAAALPALPLQPAIGSPVDLLGSRPDVRAAVVRAEAAGLSRSAALRGLLPTLAVTGSAGWEANWIDTWQTQDTWGVGANFSVPVFNGGASQAAIRASAAARDAAQLQLESTFRGAVQEVEAALVSETEQGARLDASTLQRQRAEAGWSLALDQYAGGLADYTQVQIALGSLLVARLSEVSAHRDLLGARLALTQALGGTWTHDLPALGAKQ
ncbi:MAG: TolC family protein [Oligoflexia bacterium]|nr:TolC family protein [Oligoflexia bacterium]